MSTDLAVLAQAIAGQDLTGLRDELLRESLRRSFHAFVKHFWSVIEPAREFIDGWHIEAICLHLQAITEGKIQRLLINVPPGAAKSILVSVMWPCWELGPRNRPDLRYLTFAYAEDLTVRDLRRSRAIIASPEYQRLWGHIVQINPKIDSSQRYDTMAMGWRIASSVSGVGTGERGDRVLADDPHSVQQADSQLVREATAQWWTEVVPTRINDASSSVFVVIMQRVHNDDVSGLILGNNAGEWVHLMIPQRYEPDRHCSTIIGWEDPREIEGELYWPERFPENTVARDERVMGPYAVAGQFQQIPSPRGGGIIKSEWWRLWEQPAFPDFNFVVGSCDLANSGQDIARNSYNAMTIWGAFMRGDRLNFMLKFAWRGRATTHETTQEIGLLCREHKVDHLLIEDKASGAHVASEIVRIFGRRDWRTLTIIPKGDKVGRLRSTDAIFAEGLIWAPDREWSDMVIEEVSSFPKARHDDLTDTVSQAIRFLRDNGQALLREEVEFEDQERKRYRGVKKPLYNV